MSPILTPEPEHKSVVKVLNLGQWHTMPGDQLTPSRFVHLTSSSMLQSLVIFDMFQLDHV